MRGGSSQVINTTLLALAVALALTGCTRGDSEAQVETQPPQAEAKLDAEVTESAPPPLCDPAVRDRRSADLDRAAENHLVSAAIYEGLLMETYDYARISGLDDYADRIYSHIHERDLSREGRDDIEWGSVAYSLVREALVICLDWLRGEAEGEREAWLADREGELAGDSERMDTDEGTDEHDWDNDYAYRRTYLEVIREAERMRAAAHNTGVSSGMQAMADVMEGQLPRLRELAEPFSERTPPNRWAATNDHLVVGLTLLEQSWQESIDSIRADDLVAQQLAALTLESAWVALQDAADAAP